MRTVRPPYSRIVSDVVTKGANGHNVIVVSRLIAAMMVVRSSTFADFHIDAPSRLLPISVTRCVGWWAKAATSRAMMMLCRHAVALVGSMI
jgi:hypothetical protein